MLRLANGYSFQNTTLHQSWGNILADISSSQLNAMPQETNFRYVVI